MAQAEGYSPLVKIPNPCSRCGSVTFEGNRHLVSKYSLIKFLASDKGFAMQSKSEWHEKAIKWFVEVMNK